METYGYTDPQQSGGSQKPYPYRSEKKLAAGLLGILLPAFAANKFYLGYTKEALLQILFNIVTCGIASIVPFIEGIIYLTMSDEQFDNTYVRNKKAWF
ncbi:MAG: TM2 domain-containing protein [Cruoricaptor ignavus]|nr:TM2 domain-containing protein [Cruoricaptor ignavus]